MSHETTQVRSRRRTYFVQLVIVNVAVFGGLMVFVEGLASYTLFAQRLLAARPLAERRHTEYDPELGWVNTPNTHIEDMYGAGISLNINGQRFRSDHDFGEAVPPGKLRAVCSGDSFTLGYGVDDRHTWCHLLSILEPRLETVNMGQGGYGVDQAYLWYMRDGVRFTHHIHIVAVITDDFQRMQANSILGYPKPLLDLEDGRLVAKNVPVPERAGYQIWLSNAVLRGNELRSVDLVTRAFTRLGLRALAPGGRRGEVNEKTRRVVEKLFENLAKLDAAHGRRLVVVYIPVLSELQGDGANEWLRVIETTTRALGIPLVNIVESFRAFSPTEAAALYIPEGSLAYTGAAGHLNDAGNRRVAEIVYAALMTGNPSLSRD